MSVHAGSRLASRAGFARVVVVALAVPATGCASGAKHEPTPITTPTSTPITTSTTANASPHWKPLPRAPLAGRIAAGVVWTGREVIVFGGVSRGGSATELADGAAFDPANRSWRAIAPAPPSVRGDAERGAAWTGTSAIFWAGNSPNGPAAGGLYEPRSDSWTRLPQGPLGPREGYSSVWTGKELLVVGGTSGDRIATPSAAAVDPKAGKWRLLPALDKVKGLQATGMVWDGRRAFVFGSRSLCPELGSACAKAEPFFATYDPTTDALQPIDLGNAPAAGLLDQLNPIAWTGSSVLFATSGTRAVDVVTYDPSAARWRHGRAAPCALPDPSYAERAWIGNRFVTACGADGLQLYSPATDAWRAIRPGASTMNSRAGGAIAWTGTSLIAWSGTVKEPGNPTPADGASIALGP